VKKKPTSPVVDPSALVTGVHGACVMLDCGKDKIYELLKLKELDSYREGEARRITVASIRAYTARKLAAAKSFKQARYPGQKRPTDDSPAPT
jgi:excisionase family DNA binding protein